MKKIKFLLLAIIAMVAVNTNVDAKGKKVFKEVTYNVSMDCAHCKAKIEDQIPFVKGVKDLDVNLETKKVTVKYDTAKTDSKKIKESIEKLDFTVEIVKDNDKQKK